MPQEQQERKRQGGIGMVAGTAWELAYSLSIPVIVFFFGGIILDRLIGTAPWFSLFGFVVSLAATGIIIWQKVKKYL